jgi:nucleoside-diphosphate-sugar epimerase
MRVFLAGGTGAIGRRLIPQLIARGHEVTATTRDPDKAELLFTLGATPVLMDGLDDAAVGAAVAKAQPEAIIHEMTALSGTPDFKHFDRWFAQTNRLRTEGTEHLLAAAKASGVRRFVAQSYTGWTNARDGGLVKTEADPFDPKPAPVQRETLAAIRFVEEAVTSATGTCTGRAHPRRWWRSSAGARCRSSAMARGCGRGSMSTMGRQRPLRR